MSCESCGYRLWYTEMSETTWDLSKTLFSCPIMNFRCCNSQVCVCMWYWPMSQVEYVKFYIIIASIMKFLEYFWHLSKTFQMIALIYHFWLDWFLPHPLASYPFSHNCMSHYNMLPRSSHKGSKTPSSLNPTKALSQTCWQRGGKALTRQVIARY